jgi:hypothetical protein
VARRYNQYMEGVQMMVQLAKELSVQVSRIAIFMLLLRLEI